MNGLDHRRTSLVAIFMVMSLSVHDTFVVAVPPDTILPQPQGTQRWLEKDYASQGKGEKYLLGIIREHNKNSEKVQTSSKTPEWL